MEIIYHHFETLPSTNDWVKKQLKVLAPHQLLLVTAEEQTAARGQFGRKWLSPKGDNLYVTFGFHITGDPLELTHLLALSTQKTLEAYGVKAAIKKPNDLLVNGKKIAGIFCETDQLAVTIGMGLNVNMNQELCEKIDQPATSLFVETGKLTPITTLLATLQQHFISRLTMFRPQLLLAAAVDTIEHPE